MLHGLRETYGKIQTLVTVVALVVLPVSLLSVTFYNLAGRPRAIAVAVVCLLAVGAFFVLVFRNLRKTAEALSEQREQGELLDDDADDAPPWDVPPMPEQHFGTDGYSEGSSFTE